MANLHSDLRELLSRNHSDNPEVQDLLLELELTLDTAGTPEYQYRNHPTWDTTWMDLDEAQIAVVLKHGHTVERRLVAGGWEPVTEVPGVSD
ncbi:MAG TPA: hypothetical protein VF867_17280 [Arthrobacter sp.]